MIASPVGTAILLNKNAPMVGGVLCGPIVTLLGHALPGMMPTLYGEVSVVPAPMPGEPLVNQN
jgi:hypothetical protein